VKTQRNFQTVFSMVFIYVLYVSYLWTDTPPTHSCDTYISKLSKMLQSMLLHILQNTCYCTSSKTQCYQKLSMSVCALIYQVTSFTCTYHDGIWRSGGTAPLFLTSALDLEEWSTSVSTEQEAKCGTTACLDAKQKTWPPYAVCVCICVVCACTSTHCTHACMFH